MNLIGTAGHQNADASGTHRSIPKGIAALPVKGRYGDAGKLTLDRHSYRLVAALRDQFELGIHVLPLNPKMVGCCKLQAIRPPSPVGWSWLEGGQSSPVAR